jgi:hypothetical protein
MALSSARSASDLKTDAMNAQKITAAIMIPIVCMVSLPSGRVSCGAECRLALNCGEDILDRVNRHRRECDGVWPFGLDRPFVQLAVEPVDQFALGDIGAANRLEDVVDVGGKPCPTRSAVLIGFSPGQPSLDCDGEVILPR